MVPGQLDLSVTNIAVYTLLQTAIWLYLWYGPGHRMRSRRWQTWWQLLGYASLWALGVTGMYNEKLLGIFTHISDVWHYPPIISHLSKAYFEAEIAWYCSQFLTLAVHRDLKDYYVMLFHHTITPVEIYYSYECGYAAIGLLIMFLHDTSDVCLHTAKSFHNARMKLATDTTFVLFAALFALTRLVLLPMCPYAYFTDSADHQSFCGHALAGTCSILVLLHCYWFYLIVRMVMRFALRGEVEGDIRENEVETKYKAGRTVAPADELESVPRSAVNGAHSAATGVRSRKIDKFETKFEAL